MRSVKGEEWVYVPTLIRSIGNIQIKTNYACMYIYIYKYMDRYTMGTKGAKSRRVYLQSVYKTHFKTQKKSTNNEA